MTPGFWHYVGIGLLFAFLPIIDIGKLLHRRTAAVYAFFWLTTLSIAVTIAAYPDFPGPRQLLKLFFDPIAKSFAP
ncbi:hypothetical protein [Paenibacillus sp. NPDC058071]|uniref:hypothetical protein n=1 Tax=Paenibacillus sp. NPDC058071 TaxID=3346326 RepID=UPI0036DA6A0B